MPTSRAWASVALTSQQTPQSGKPQWVMVPGRQRGLRVPCNAVDTNGHTSVHAEPPDYLDVLEPSHPEEPTGLGSEVTCSDIFTAALNDHKLSGIKQYTCFFFSPLTALQARSPRRVSLGHSPSTSQAMSPRKGLENSCSCAFQPLDGYTPLWIY